MNLPLNIRILWWLTIALQVWIAYRIFRGYLGQSFRAFGWYAALSSLVSISLSLITFIPKSKYYYGLFFIIWTYAVSIVEFFLIRELVTDALRPYRAIRDAYTRTLAGFAIVLAALGSFWYLYLSSFPTGKGSAIIQAALRFQQSVALGFTLFVFLFLAFLAWMPVPLTRNLMRHCFLMGALFLAITVSRFSVELGTFAIQKSIADYIGLGGVVIVLTIWCSKIRTGADNSLATPKGPIDTAAATVLAARLEELDQSLARSGPKVFR